ncbi:MAG TPA: hypothetical protein VKU82_09685 [Planctomycetaceae bacterium]|nr:hypothetical protein [Planctomycetaceae bacterium]
MLSLESGAEVQPAPFPKGRFPMSKPMKMAPFAFQRRGGYGDVDGQIGRAALMFFGRT